MNKSAFLLPLSLSFSLTHTLSSANPLFTPQMSHITSSLDQQFIIFIKLRNMFKNQMLGFIQRDYNSVDLG